MASLLQAQHYGQRNGATSVEPYERAGYRPPALAAPGESSGKRVNLIVMATRKREQLSDEFFEPWSALGKTH